MYKLKYGDLIDIKIGTRNMYFLFIDSVYVGDTGGKSAMYSK